MAFNNPIDALAEAKRAALENAATLPKRAANAVGGPLQAGIGAAARTISPALQKP